MLRPLSWRPSLNFFVWMPGDIGSLHHCPFQSIVPPCAGLLEFSRSLISLSLVAPFMCLSVAGSAWKEGISWEAWPGWLKGEEMGKPGMGVKEEGMGLT